MKKVNVNSKKKEMNKETNNSYDLLQTDPVDINSINMNDYISDDILEQTMELSSIRTSYEELEDDMMVKSDMPELDFVDNNNNEVEEDISATFEKEFSNTIIDTPNSDIDTMFTIANNSIVEAKNIFVKNNDVKRQIDEKIKELETLKEEHEAKKQADYNKIKAYKEEVYNKLKLKKEEIEGQFDRLKDLQMEFEKSKIEFEEYKKNELDQIRLIKAKQKKFIDEKRNELDTLEQDIKIQKEVLDEEKRQLELDRIKYDVDKNELSNNLLKFNELVSDFTINIDKFNDEENKVEEPTEELMN